LPLVAFEETEAVVVLLVEEVVDVDDDPEDEVGVVMVGVMAQVTAVESESKVKPDALRPLA
jgi:hypothetical protein